MLGPFINPPFDLHISPFMSIEKSDSDKRRIIVDLSWPKGFSVNDAVEQDSYLGTNFALTLPTIDHVIKSVLKFGRGSYIAKIDISRAFKHLPIDPKDVHYLGLHWGAYYLESSLVFGYKHGSKFYQRLLDSVRYIMAQEGYHILNYIDDHVIFGQKRDCQKAFDRLSQLHPELGLTISQHKNVNPSKRVICLGILVDTDKFTLEIPAKKFAEIKSSVHFWSHKTKCSKTQLQSLLGSLLYVSKCVQYSRFFLNRLLQLLRDNYQHKIINLTENAQRDIQSFKSFCLYLMANLSLSKINFMKKYTWMPA